MMDSPTSGAH